MSDTERPLLSPREPEVGAPERRAPAPADIAPEGAPSEASLTPLRDRPNRNRERRRERLNAEAAAGDQELVASPRRRDAAERRQPLSPVTPLPQMPDRPRHESTLALPQQQRGRRYGTLLTFLVFVALPIVIASIYYLLFASDQYVSEFRFAVREAANTSTTSTTLSTSGLSSLLGAATSSTPIENYAVADYLLSRQVVDELQQAIKVKALYSRPSIDRWSRFDPSKPTEEFVTYWQGMVRAQFDQITGIASARVRAFTPDDAYLIATTMMSLAEKLVNDIAMRSRRDALRFAEQEVNRAQERLRLIRAQISEYRDKESVIDPTSNVVASNTTLAQTLRTTLMQYETELSALRQQSLRPDAPAVVALQSRIYAAKQQLAMVESQVATAKEGNRPLSRVVSQYEQLELERQVAQTILTSSIQSLEQARVNASIQHLYVTPFVRPARPESSTYPERFKSIATIGLICFFLWTIGVLVTRSILDHLA